MNLIRDSRREAQQRKGKEPGKESKEACYRCGNVGHYGRDPNCPARGKTCKKCGGANHFAQECKTKSPKAAKPRSGGKLKDTKKKVRYVQDVDDDEDEYAVIVKSTSQPGKIEVFIGGILVEMVVDSGASTNVMDKHLWSKLQQEKIECVSKKSNKKLYPYGSKQSLEILGTFLALTKVGETIVKAEFVVIDGEGEALLGRETAVQLGVLQFGVPVYSLKSKEEILHDYKRIFEGVGKLTGFQVKLHVDPEVPAVAQPVRRTPFSLREKVKEKIEELVAMDIIEPVEGPTPWVSPVVVVPKQNDEIPLCVDMRRANEAIITLLRLAELVLTLNCFSFGDNYYKQINGVAMGTKMGPSYANLFVGFIENKFFSNYHGPKPDLYKRYIDDCVGATSSSKEELNLFINSVNSFHPALKYTWEISENSLAFLDIKLSINDNGLSTSVHYKPTDSHNYLLHSSSHPQHVKNAIPFSQFLRLRRLCSDDTDFNNKCEEMCQFFKKRGYPDSAVTTGKHRAQEIDRETALQTSQNEETDRIPFTLTYHPQNLAIKNVILKNFKILNNDPETKHIFSLPPLISFKRDKNLGNFLVRSAFKFNNKPGTFTCKRTRCKTCPFISNTVNISGPNRSVKVTDHFTCISSNVIYCITCTLCKKIYIGETGRRLADRFREHLRDAEQNNTDASKPVARHFNLPNHSHHNMTICGLYLHHGNTESRKNLEQKLIFQLGTLSPHGINERLSFH